MGIFDKLRGRGRDKDEAPPPGEMAPRVLAQAAGDRQIASRGVIVVRSPDGTEQRLEIAMKPVTIGSWAQCDIVIEDEEIRPVHVRVSALAVGEFRIHGIAAPSLRPYATNIARPDEWMLVNAGDEVTLGNHVIQFLAPGSAEESESTEPAPADQPAANAPAAEAPPPPASEQQPEQPAPEGPPPSD